MGEDEESEGKKKNVHIQTQRRYTQTNKDRPQGEVAKEGKTEDRKLIVST